MFDFRKENEMTDGEKGCISVGQSFTNLQNLRSNIFFSVYFYFSHSFYFVLYYIYVFYAIMKFGWGIRCRNIFHYSGIIYS